ncbi:MAG: hypothetical protein NHB14_04140 [Desulfosporosinus sp.]|nr:hypothetical protein [Desulfosporosinus sp.]
MGRLLTKDSYHLIVSPGYGTWGPPLRIGTNPEMVDLHSSSKKHVRSTMQLPNRSIAVFLLSDKEEINFN